MSLFSAGILTVAVAMTCSSQCTGSLVYKAPGVNRSADDSPRYSQDLDFWAAGRLDGQT
jgi:hypothetical protein